MQVLPEEDSYLSIQNLNKLKYMENVIKETLRLYPTVPMIGRTILEDVILPSTFNRFLLSLQSTPICIKVVFFIVFVLGGKKIPANSHVNIFIYSIQRNPKIFENPEEFRPERFDDDDFKKYPYAFIPFSAGPRNCIGMVLMST